MPEHAIVAVGDLDAGLVLAPERYDPRRRPAAPGADDGGSALGALVEVATRQVSAKTADPARGHLVLDTGDARDGVLRPSKAPVPGRELGSSKKLVRPGDVLISRLRPYLRQVAYVDPGLALDGVEIVCSTEFYVLRPPDGASIAFLVPVLLSARVQELLAAAQEGGHHPRVNLATLEAIPIPAAVLAQREDLSRAVEQAVADARRAEGALHALVGELDDPSAR